MIGVDVHINASNPSLPFPQSGEAAQLARGSARLARTDLAWWMIETTRGVFEFSATGFDALVDELFGASISPLLTLDFVNTLLD